MAGFPREFLLALGEAVKVDISAKRVYASDQAEAVFISTKKSYQTVDDNQYPAYGKFIKLQMHDNYLQVSVGRNGITSAPQEINLFEPRDNNIEFLRGIIKKLYHVFAIRQRESAKRQRKQSARTRTKQYKRNHRHGLY